MAISTEAPTRERGQAIITGLPGVMPWSTFLDDREHVPELRWPESVRSYDMIRTDSQVAALLAGFTMPIYRYRWRLDPNGAPANVVARLSEDLNLPIIGKKDHRRGRLKRRFSFQRHIREAIGFSLIWGHMYFEQVGEDDGTAWRLRKLAGRMPYTINEIAVEQDGGLRYIRQNLGPQAPELPVNNLVAYIQQQEPGNWVGRSWLRELYKHWLIKDRLYRVDAMKHERNGMGVPIVEAAEGTTGPQMQELNALAALYKAGEASGGAMPYGAKLRLVGTEGTLPDTMASIREHDQAMARRFMLMLMELGQTQTGSRALGGEFSDYVQLGQDCLADDFADTFNEHVIEDAVDWSDGEDVPAPLLVYDRDDDPELSVADFALLVEKKVLSVDEQLEDYAREKYNLPARSGPRPAPQAPPVFSPPGAPTGPVPPAPAPAPPVAGSAAVLPSRKLRRGPTDHELAAQVNFASLDTSIDTGVQQLVKAWEANIKPAHVEELGKQIKSAKRLTDVTKIQATARGADELLAILRQGAGQGIAAATAEVQAQGVAVKEVTTEAVDALLQQRATAMSELMARSIGEAAARNGARIWTSRGTATATADTVKSYLLGLTDDFLTRQFTGLYMAGLNAGRMAVFGQAEGEPAFYASELLDTNTCDACEANDGQGYATEAEAAADYPAGGFIDCAGGPSCRGTIIAEFISSGGPDAGGLEF